MSLEESIKNIQESLETVKELTETVSDFWEVIDETVDKVDEVQKKVNEIKSNDAKIKHINSKQDILDKKIYLLGEAIEEYQWELDTVKQSIPDINKPLGEQKTQLKQANLDIKKLEKQKADKEHKHVIDDIEWLPALLEDIKNKPSWPVSVWWYTKWVRAIGAGKNVTVDESDPRIPVFSVDNIPSLQFDVDAVNEAHSEWQINWNADDKTLEIHTDVNDVRIQLWQENVLRVVNKTWSTILNGSVVYVNWAQWNRPTIALADADIANTADAVIWVVTADITNNHNWYVTTFWLVRNLDTSVYSAWDTLYLSSTAWLFTDTIPSEYTNKVKVWHVIVAHWTQWIILVDINIYEKKNPLSVLQNQNFYVDTIVNNQITEWHWEDTTTIVNTYNGDNKLTTALYTFPDTTTVTLTITYDVNGNLSTALYS